MSMRVIIGDCRDVLAMVIMQQFGSLAHPYAACWISGCAIESIKPSSHQWRFQAFFDSHRKIFFGLGYLMRVYSQWREQFRLDAFSELRMAAFRAALERQCFSLCASDGAAIEMDRLLGMSSLGCLAIWILLRAVRWLQSKMPSGTQTEVWPRVSEFLAGIQGYLHRQLSRQDRQVAIAGVLP